MYMCYTAWNRFLAHVKLCFDFFFSRLIYFTFTCYDLSVHYNTGRMTRGEMVAIAFTNTFLSSRLSKHQLNACWYKTRYLAPSVLEISVMHAIVKNKI